MPENREKRYQFRAAEKTFEWLRRSKPAVAAREQEESEGIALPPNERGCGTAYPMRGTNREDLTEWCIEHET